MARKTSHPEPTAGQLMSRPVQTVSASDPLRKVAELFTEQSISAAAVLDREKTPVGVITKTDLVRYENRREGTWDELDRKNAGTWSEEGLPIVNEDETVGRWMTPVIFSVEPSTPAGAVARRMVKYGTHHIFVKGPEGNKIEGIVSSFDLLRVFAKEQEPES